MKYLKTMIRFAHASLLAVALFPVTLLVGVAISIYITLLAAYAVTDKLK